ncbi:DUF1656 domain-containing protein [Pseudodonghicola xiamenensis]|uniref:DUF1656 domain-containing protein n=1 Tax=Pseudodonghicola xiamenensis TaxID=337702 RepID=A0A8J3HCE9_9RHOB|nr:DUF1656 domain-containing protein [Pseudodonghicola xiamenensis]GHH03384.1 DUF1656 domain-containing protein [Pseudodonghicola xiamenensis]
MKPDIDLFGIFIPSLLIAALACYLVYRLLHAGLARTGLYRHVWHPALFDVALYFTVLGTVMLCLEQAAS